MFSFVEIEDLRHMNLVYKISRMPSTPTYLNLCFKINSSSIPVSLKIINTN